MQYIAVTQNIPPLSHKRKAATVPRRSGESSSRGMSGGAPTLPSRTNQSADANVTPSRNRSSFGDPFNQGDFHYYNQCTCHILPFIIRVIKNCQ